MFPLFYAHATFVGCAAFDAPPQPLPIGAAAVQLGFPSPAEDFEEDRLDLNRLLVRNPLATYIYRASGHSMARAGVLDGDLLVVDRSVTPQNGSLVMAVWEGNQPACKILRICERHIELHSANPEFPPIVIESCTEVEVFVVVSIARQVKRAAVPRAAGA
ncbi:LexA family protein [Luteimonas terrae]|uniref:Translesion error-prone DNA polymerase V autoproteolytic subunit n=1 Tax=Luteimonas terrae TaxID=1530191 RepID=A0A4R5U8X4_9GAMM|nr:translesion error-prone DNA polymerase V autoproteolytic subunit [Luteimonas terrae]TDK30951.1 translesion error-prone DNA polymerase V autoproteolytic subunit [Luteimonas terrae]